MTFQNSATSWGHSAQAYGGSGGGSSGSHSNYNPGLHSEPLSQPTSQQTRQVNKKHPGTRKDSGQSHLPQLLLNQTSPGLGEGGEYLTFTASTQVTPWQSV